MKHVAAKQKQLADKRREAEEAEAKLAADVDAASDAAGAAAAIEALSQKLAEEEEVCGRAGRGLTRRGGAA
jgi:hypothetical protein